MVREQENALKASRLAASVKLSDLLLNFERGPWQNQKWWRILEEEAITVIQNLLESKERPLLKWLLPRISRETGIPLHELGPKQVAEMLQEAGFLHRLGSSNTSRWDVWHAGFKARSHEWGLMLLVCMAYGIKMEWISSQARTDALDMPCPASKAGEEASSSLADQKSVKRINSLLDAKTSYMWSRRFFSAMRRCPKRTFGTTLPVFFAMSSTVCGPKYGAAMEHFDGTNSTAEGNAWLLSNSSSLCFSRQIS